jgi:NADH:ubiquinone oxidoreductase subunit E
MLQNPAMSRRHVRPVPAAVLEEVRSLVGEAPRRDLLIECLHRIQDAHGHLDAERLAALAQLMKLARAEVYEVATFYHHFDVVREGEAPPPPLTVRVCDSVACAMAGAEELIAAISRSAWDGVRVQRVPCVGRCECAPVAVVGQNPVEEADVHAVRYAIDAGAIEAPLPEGARRMADYRAAAATGSTPIALRHAAVPRRSSPRWSTPTCAASAARAFRPGASGASCATSPRRA